MTKPGFRFNQTSPEAGVAIFHLAGRLFGYGPCWDFLESLRDTTDEFPNVILDMENVEYADSTGVGILAAAYASVQNAGGSMVLSGMNDRVRTILDVLWFLKVLEHTPNVEEGLKKLQASATGG